MKKRQILKNVSEISIDQGFDMFLNSKIALNRSKYTVNYYYKRFGSFMDFLEENNVTKTNEVTENLINKFIIFKRTQNPNISNNTINTILRAIRAVLYYFMSKGYTDYFVIPMITTKKTPKEGYTQNEQEALAEKPNLKTCSFPEYRNWVIICHLLASGNRARTIRGIKNKHVDLKNKYILLTEVKNNQVYEMPISSEYYPILLEYMNVRKGDAEDYLFCSQYGGQLSEGGFRVIMRKYNLKHNVTTIGIHRFRNTFAKNWIMEGGSSKKLQYALGHSDPKMVDEYILLYGRDLKEDYSRLTPLAHLKGKIECQRAIMKKRTLMHE